MHIEFIVENLPRMNCLQELSSHVFVENSSKKDISKSL